MFPELWSNSQLDVSACRDAGVDTACQQRSHLGESLHLIRNEVSSFSGEHEIAQEKLQSGMTVRCSNLGCNGAMLTSSLCSV